MATETASGQTVNSVYAVYNGMSVKVGMSIKDVGKPLSVEVKTDPIMRKQIVESTFKNGLVVSTLPEKGVTDLIYQIDLFDPVVILSNGLHTGMSEQDLSKRMGQPGGSGVDQGRRYISYYYYDAGGNLELILIAYINPSGEVEQLELATPII